MVDEPQVKPTPTQEELDRHVRGERLTTHEHDGSSEQPSANAGQHGHHLHERMTIPEGMNYISPEESAKIEEDKMKEEEETKKVEPRKEKSAEADRDTASYRTRSTQAEKTRKSDKERD